LICHGLCPLGIQIKDSHACADVPECQTHFATNATGTAIDNDDPIIKPEKFF
jgi:hypothetical protein